MDGFDLIVAIEVARKKIMLSGADISFDEINSISAILKKSADRIEELEARVKELEGESSATTHKIVELLGVIESVGYCGNCYMKMSICSCKESK